MTAFSNAALYRLPIVDFGGKESYVLVNPNQVTAMEPDTQDIGEEVPFAKTVTGTRLVVSGEVYFVPMKPETLASALQLDVIEIEAIIA
jgi:hypothetical protein